MKNEASEVSNRKPRKLWWIAILGFLAACAPKLEPESSCNFVQNSQEQRVSWKGNVPIEFKVHKSVPVEYRGAIYLAAAAWELRTGQRLFEFKGIDYSDKPAKKDGSNVIYWLEEWDSSKESEQARTTIYWKLDRIEEADLRINAENFTYFTDEIDAGTVHLKSLVVHELGHVLGLKHNEKEGSVMNSILANFALRDEISDHELDSFKCEYF